MLAGASSWADRSLVRDGTFYPSRSLNAAQKLAYYATRLPMAEIATTFRFPPTPQLAQRWVDNTPEGFTFDVRAWSLLCGAPTWPESLWPDLLGEVKRPRQAQAKLYRHHLPPAVVDECWARFNYALRPLVEAARLGVVVMRYPGWFIPRPAAWEELAELPRRLNGLRVAVELRNHRWFEGDACETTLAFLEELGLCFVCRDRPGEAEGSRPEGSRPGAARPGAGRPVVAATGDIAFVRFPGRSRWWEEQGQNTGADPAGTSPGAVPGAGGDPSEPTTKAQVEELDLTDSASVDVPWRYRYSGDELAAWLPAVADLASGTTEVHLVMDNCWRADAVDNASALLDLLR